MARPRLVITRRIYQEVVASLQTEFDILADNQATDQPWDQQALQQRIAQADYMLCSVADKIDASVIAAAARLKVIATGAVGFNNIDVAACKARGIRLTNTPDVLTQTTADFGFALRWPRRAGYRSRSATRVQASGAAGPLISLRAAICIMRP